MHTCYLACIYGIPMELLAPDWTKFVDEIVPNLIGLAKLSKLVKEYTDFVSNPFSSMTSMEIFNFRIYFPSGNHRIFENPGSTI